MKEKRTAYIQMKVLPSVKAMAVESAEKSGRTMSNYIENLIKEDYERRNGKMKKYVFSEYRDKAGIGSDKVFDTKREAVTYAAEKWNTMTNGDRKSYMQDPCGTFNVYEIEITQEQIENWEYLDVQYQDLWTADVWNALEQE